MEPSQTENDPSSINFIKLFWAKFCHFTKKGRKSTKVHFKIILYYSQKAHFSQNTDVILLQEESDELNSFDEESSSSSSEVSIIQYWIKAKKNFKYTF